MSEQNSGTEPVELTVSELDSVAGGKPTAFVKQPIRAHVSMGNDNRVSNSGGSVSIGTNDMVWITQTNTNSNSISGAATTPSSS